MTDYPMPGSPRVLGFVCDTSGPWTGFPSRSTHPLCVRYSERHVTGVNGYDSVVVGGGRDCRTQAESSVDGKRITETRRVVDTSWSGLLW